MKKIFNVIAFAYMLVSFSSCATVFGGKVGTCQRTPPAPGQEMRKVRTGALIADIVFFPPGIFIDFMTCAIFKPCDDVAKKAE
ncbi:MAG: hypothetical protein ABI763_03350 [Bacteroidota bacterium]